MRTPCKKVLLKYLDTHPGFHKKVNLYAVAEDWEAVTVDRTLRKLREQEIIQVDYYDGRYTKGLVMYASKNNTTKKPSAFSIVERDGRMVAVMN